MSITALNNYAIGDVNFNTMMTTLDKTFKGKADITISEYDTDSAPDVKVGSVFENNGSLFIVDSTDITPTGYSGISVSTTFYLYYDESATAFIYSSTVPTWSDALQGWYNGNDRAFFSMYKDSGGTLYDNKTKLQDQNNIIGTVEILNSGSSWTAPANVYRVKATIVGGGGGGGGVSFATGGSGSTGGTTIFNGTSALGGLGGRGANASAAGGAGRSGMCAGNHGIGAMGGNEFSALSGSGGQIIIKTFTIAPLSVIAYTIGSGGAGGTSDLGLAGGAGGSGQIILEY